MSRLTSVIILKSLCLIASTTLGLISISGFASPNAASQAPTEINRRADVEIETEQQALSGIQTLMLQPESFLPEMAVYGNALNLQPLLDLRNRYLSALAETQNSRARLQLTQKAMARTRHLHDSGVKAKRALEEQQALFQSEQALSQNAQWTAQGIRNEAIMNWGEKLSGLFLQQDSLSVAPYLNGQQALLLITFPSATKLNPAGQKLTVSPSGQRDQAQNAEWIDKAPQLDGLTQGESHFFTTRHPGIRPGARVAAWLPKQQEALSGVIIPGTALIWHLGQAFVYIKTGPEHFNRRAIQTFDEAQNGYFISQGLEAGEEIVITGSQMLLSEEFKAQIPDEDDDD
jgi:hypothetical protein